MQKFETFGARLKRLRGERGWSQITLAEKSKIGVRLLANYESSRSVPGYWKLLTLAKTLDCTLDDLMLGEQHEERTFAYCIAAEHRAS